ncbi:C2 domain-containing protein [Mycotypha africana]|uniref:C2 domain-containing protein n=1 Tax=Mycotypha africana TaxID=64632 RepID=UPI0023010743|nr:C2 domain-containing protein [Mycotypha africana]KAI8987394.1 C2 domain-containing protein [Mycotypha africana]
MSKPRIIGQLVIVAYKAKYLPEREVVGKQDPFVIFRIGETIERTKTDYRGGQHPIWDDQVILPIPEKKTKVVCQVYDEDGKRQELISETELDLTKVLTEGEQDGWFPLSYKNRSAGEIYLELTFYAARPPPKRTPTRFGMSKPYRTAGGYVPATVPQQTRPYISSPQYPPQPTNGRPPHGPVPVESQSTPVHQNHQYRPPQQYRPQYPPQPNPTPSMSNGSQHSYSSQQSYPPVPVPSSSTGTNGRPMSYGGYRPPPSSTAAPLLTSSYKATHDNNMPGGFNGGYPPMNSNNGIYPPQQANSNMAGNRNSYPLYANSHPHTGSYPPQQLNAFPEPQHMSMGGYVPHSDPVMGTPFAAHQGSSIPLPNNHQGYPPHSPAYPPY